MAKGVKFVSPDRLAFSFPYPIETDEQRILYALWRERVQPLDRLCMQTGLDPTRVLVAVRHLAKMGRVRADALREWLSKMGADADISANDREVIETGFKKELAHERVSLA